MQWGTEPGSPPRCARRFVWDEGWGPHPRGGGWVLGPSSGGLPCCASLLDPGSEPTSLGLESGAPVRPLGSHGNGVGSAAGPSDYQASRWGQRHPPTPLQSPPGLVGTGRKCHCVPGCMISLVSALRTPRVQKVITVFILKFSQRIPLQNHELCCTRSQFAYQSFFFFFFRKTLENADLSHENLCRVLI